MVRLSVIAIAVVALGCGGGSDAKQESRALESPQRTDATTAYPAERWNESLDVRIDEPTSLNLVTCAAVIVPPAVQQGETATLLVRVKVYDGWHIYGVDLKSGPSQPTRIDVELVEGIKFVGDWSNPTPRNFPAYEGIVPVYESDVLFSRPLEIAATAAPGRRQVSIVLRYQACDATRCMPPSELDVNVPLEIQPRKE